MGAVNICLLRGDSLESKAPQGIAQISCLKCPEKSDVEEKMRRQKNKKSQAFSMLSSVKIFPQSLSRPKHHVPEVLGKNVVYVASVRISARGVDVRERAFDETVSLAQKKGFSYTLTVNHK